jgi:glycosyltransferase involved in cell wall biosynthesis
MMIKVFIICSGLGHIRRGYESFTQECFDALAQDPAIDITLYKGGGKSSKKQIALWNLPRNSPWTRRVARIVTMAIRKAKPHLLEQVTFGFSLLLDIYFKKPDVIIFSQPNLGNMLWHWRRLTKRSYKLLFSNGGPWLPPGFERWDHVQQLVPIYLQAAIDFGEPAEKHSLLPYGVNIELELELLSSLDRLDLRRDLGLPAQQPLLLSVGAINKFHKRMDYLINEVANLPEPRPYLLLLGQEDAESAEIMAMGNNLLGSDNFQVRCVNQDQIHKYYKVADAFILASLREGLPRVILEAMSYGLICLAHDYGVTQFVVEDKKYLGDFNLNGSLAALIPQALIESQDRSIRHRIHRYVGDRFSWDILRSGYIDLIQRCHLPLQSARAD